MTSDDDDVVIWGTDGPATIRVYADGTASVVFVDGTMRTGGKALAYPDGTVWIEWPDGTKTRAVTLERMQ